MESGRIWRIRIKYAREDLTKEAWDRNEVGIWYGAWRADDLRNSLSKVDVAESLSNCPAQLDLRWKVTKTWADTAVRFAQISPSDWVFVYFDGELHFARTSGEFRSDANHPLNRDDELFKYWPIWEKKSFHLAELPDCFRLLPSAGRGNVHELHGTNRRLAELLARCESEECVRSAIDEMSLQTWLATLGPNSWESICLGYLILKYGFVPTGLVLGRTLPVFDIIGRDRDGRKIFAQCKKDPGRVKIEEKFLNQARVSTERAMYFYFAYGGCAGELPQDVRVLSQDDIGHWLNSEPDGQKYIRFLKS